MVSPRVKLDKHLSLYCAIRLEIAPANIDYLITERNDDPNPVQLDNKTA